MYGYGMGGMGWGMWFFWLIIIVGAVIVIALLVRSAGNRGGAVAPETPEQILKRRFAAGEIGEEEYRKRLEELRR